MLSIPRLSQRLRQCVATPRERRLTRELQEANKSLEDANRELQLCVHTLFEQKHHYESQMAHLAELLRGSECEIGGVSIRWRRDI